MSAGAALAPAVQAIATAHAAVSPTPAMKSRAFAAAQKFEANFIAQMFDLMEQSVPTDPNFGGGPSEPIYRSMLDQQYAAAIAARGGIGIAKQIYQEILTLQEAHR